MKKIFIFLLLLVILSANSQVRFVSTSNSSVNSSAFIDASSQSTNNGTVGTGKGLVFPRVDLSTFSFVSGTTGVSTNFPTRYDGMIVYNTKDGGVANVGITSGVLTPGFWFYENKSSTLLGGIWKSLNSISTVKDITNTEIVLDTKVNGAQLYAISGSFTADGSSASITVSKPTGMTGYYSFVVYKEGKTFRNTIVSFDTDATTNNVVTGSGLFTEVYPAGTYNFVLQYFK